jgi:hypothetical protein
MTQIPSQSAPSIADRSIQSAANSKATASMIFGIIGFILSVGSFCLLALMPFCALIFPIMGALGSLILGYQAKREIAASNGTMQGGGQATVGIILGWLNAGIALIMLIFVVLFVLGMLGLGILGNLNR